MTNMEKLSQEHQNQWSRVRTNLKSVVGDAAFNSWLKPLSVSHIEEGEVVLTVPTRFMRDWVVSHYLEHLRALWTNENASVQAVNIFVRAPAKPTPRLEEESKASFEGSGSLPKKGRVSVTDEVDIGAPLDSRFTFDNFVVGKPNELAFAAAQRVGNSAAVPFNPLFLYGGVGLGKTHLMHAIAWHIRSIYPDRRVIYLSAEKFMYQFIRALRFKNVMAFKHQFRSVDVLMIDDVQFIAGKDTTQEEFFHTFNALVDQNRQIVISGDRSPSNQAANRSLNNISKNYSLLWRCP